MTIKTRLFISSLISTILICVIVGIMFYSNFLSENKTQLTSGLSGVIRDIAELNSLTNEYMMFREDRMRQQWQLKYANLGKLLERITIFKGWNRNDRYSLELVTSEFKALGDLPLKLDQINLEKIRLLEEKAQVKEIELMQNLEQKELSQAVLRSQRMSTEAFKLFKKKDYEMGLFRQKVNLITIFLTLVFLISSVLFSYLTLRAVVNPLSEIIKYTKIYARGELDNRVTIKTTGVIGQLGESINKMAHDLKAAQDVIKQHSRELEIRIAERIKELNDVYGKMARTEKLAALGKMAGMVSHELRNPLGVIRNSIYFLRMKLGKSMEDEKVASHFDILEKEVVIADKIIADILMFGSIKEPELRKVNLGILIGNSLGNVSIPENVELVRESIAELLVIMADADQLEKVFSNLILNAVQSMPHGGKLTLSGAEKGKFIEIAVIDTGEGILKENLGKIFDPFFTTKAKGVGLGLSICKSIVESHMGHIKIESEPGKGTKFIVQLPVGEA